MKRLSTDNMIDVLTRGIAINGMDFSRFTILDKELKIDKSRPVQKRDDKPVGLWYAYGGEWLEWLESNMPDRLSGRAYIYALSVRYADPFVRVTKPSVWRLSSQKAVLDFNETYGELRDGYNPEIRWDWVAKEWAGIEISPYQGRLRSHMDLRWYYTWDVASGCIWDPAAIREVHPIASGTLEGGWEVAR